jgi:hypothetical protein
VISQNDVIIETSPKEEMIVAIFLKNEIKVKIVIFPRNVIIQEEMVDVLNAMEMTQEGEIIAMMIKKVETERRLVETERRLVETTTVATNVDDEGVKMMVRDTEMMRDAVVDIVVVVKMKTDFVEVVVEAMATIVVVQVNQNALIGDDERKVEMARKTVIMYEEKMKKKEAEDVNQDVKEPTVIHGVPIKSNLLQSSILTPLYSAKLKQQMKEVRRKKKKPNRRSLDRRSLSQKRELKANLKLMVLMKMTKIGKKQKDALLYQNGLLKNCDQLLMLKLWNQMM